MNKLIEIMYVFSQYEYITFVLLALLFPLVMQIASIVFPEKVKTKEVFLSYLSTLSGVIYYLSYLGLGYFANVAYSQYMPLFYVVVMTVIILELLYIMYNKFSTIFALLPLLLMAPVTLTNQLHWSISAMFLITYILSNVIFFFVFKRYDRE